VFTARYELNVSVQFREIAQEVRSRSPTSEAWFRSQHSPCEIFGGQSSTGTGICPSTSVFPCQHHSTSAVYSSSSTCYSYQKDKRVKSWNLPKTIAFPVIGVHWTESSFTFLILKGLRCEQNSRSLTKAVSSDDLAFR
jgi:hypothetical protein